MQDCLVCGTGLGWCNKHAPLYGDHVRVNDLSIYVGTIPLMSVLFDLMTGQKPIKYWMGTDILTMIMYPPHKNRFIVLLHRIKMRLLDYVLYEHWFVTPRLMKIQTRKPQRHIVKPSRLNQ